ncbi:MAG: hypothetical protein Q8936_01360 [Bacillota bacterium]|nr:hypothetical protein [Bacillota bacterium]
MNNNNQKTIGELKLMKWTDLDQKQKQVGEEIKYMLQEKYKYGEDNVLMIYTNINCHTYNRGMSVHIYRNKYDYITIDLKFPYLEAVTALDYFETVVYALENKKYVEHKATEVEKFLVNMLDKFRSLHLNLFDGELTSENSNYVIDINDIKNIYWDIEKSSAEIVDSEGRYVVDFRDESISQKEIYLDEAEENVLVKLNKYIKLVNDSWLSNVEYKIEDDILVEIDLSSKNELKLFNINQIKNISQSEYDDEEMYVGLKGEEVCYLTYKGAMA